jgi:hypothetical protein
MGFLVTQIRLHKLQKDIEHTLFPFQTDHWKSPTQNANCDKFIDLTSQVSQCHVLSMSSDYAAILGSISYDKMCAFVE